MTDERNARRAAKAHPFGHNRCIRRRSEGYALRPRKSHLLPLERGWLRLCSARQEQLRMLLTTEIPTFVLPTPSADGLCTLAELVPRAASATF